jgi:hypothetical protein
LLRATTTGLEGSTGRAPDERDCFLICLHALASGLLRVKLQGPAGGRTSLATPLVDGMVVSRRALGSVVRQTALNMCRRRRLDNDRYDFRETILYSVQTYPDSASVLLWVGLFPVMLCGE